MKRLIISDIHFGSRGISSIKEMIKKFFHVYYEDLKTLDYIIISGDYYDSLLEFNNEEAINSMETLFLIGNFCLDHNIKLRCLEGTDSHDRKQLMMFDKLVQQKRTLEGLDFLYVKEIEVVEESDHTCLYIPDNIRDSIITTQFDALEEVRKYGGNVDQCIMHGAFPHSLGFGDETTLFSEEFMLNLVKGFIIAGHIHTHQVYSRILTPGSFTRLKFGQEESKGGLLIEDDTFRFLENKDADTFLTIDSKAITQKELLDDISPIITTLPTGANVRILLDSGNPLGCGLDLSTFREDINFVIKTKKEETVVEEIEEDKKYIRSVLDMGTLNKYVTENFVEEGEVTLDELLKEFKDA